MVGFNRPQVIRPRPDAAPRSQGLPKGAHAARPRRQLNIGERNRVVIVVQAAMCSPAVAVAAPKRGELGSLGWRLASVVGAQAAECRRTVAVAASKRAVLGCRRRAAYQLLPEGLASRCWAICNQGGKGSR